MGIVNELLKAPTYQVEIQHPGLNKYRVIRGRDRRVVEQKANAQMAAWNAMWQRTLRANEARQARESLAEYKEEMKQLAAQRTGEAEESLSRLATLLERSLHTAYALSVEQAMDHRHFPDPEPKRPIPPLYRPKPDRTWDQYTYRPNFLFTLFPSLGRRRQKQLADALHSRVRAWRDATHEIARDHQALCDEYHSACEQWRDTRDAFLHDQEEHNKWVSATWQGYANGEPSAVIEYFHMVLENSEYPDDFPAEHESEYRDDNKTLVVDYSLPTLECIPSVKSVKYVASREELVESPLSHKVRQQTYDDVVYQLALRTLHEIYRADTSCVLDSVVFNGIVRYIDAATGQETEACIISIQAGRDEFLQLSLEHVEPRACFRRLRGRGSASLYAIVPIAPIQQINRDDCRFVASHNVMGTLNDTMNLAALDWEDFEHLVRDVFEAELSVPGGEVRVTRASRDGGVDAIAFDPDPIRGGKIVIQAKRYTQVVGVAAVRDLFGTVMNEGATKGILVTTSHYGPDAYEFAKDKPIALLDGNHLLHLLQKHGHRARIDLDEARRLNVTK